MHNHPCRCDKCYAARDAELARAREGMAQMLEVEARARAVGPQRLALFVAAKAVRRGAFSPTGTDGAGFIVDAMNKHEAGHSGCFCPHCNPQP